MIHIAAAIGLATGLLGQNAAIANRDVERAAIAGKIAPVLANPPATGLLIFGIEPNSQAAKAGLQLGDILTIYDAQPVESTSALSQLARKANAEGRKRLAVIAQRGSNMVDAEFDLAPMGLRMIPVKQGEKRVLWRPDTPYTPDMSALGRCLAQPHRYEVLTMGNKTIGWTHTYFTRQTESAGERIVMRIQSRLDSELPTSEQGPGPAKIDEKRDVVVSFGVQPNLPIQSMWIQVQDKVVLEAEATLHGQIVGSRVGVPTSAPLPSDTVSSYLTGMLATTMPLKKAACRHCSYLEPFSLVAAPFADIYCVGSETLQNSAGQKAAAYHFEQTVFGEVVGDYWIDSKRELIQSTFPNGVRSTRTPREEVLKRFPDMESTFSNIQDLPQIRRNGPQAN